MNKAAAFFWNYIRAAKKWKPQIFLAALALLYFAAAPKKEKSVTSALLNPKYQADKIELFEPGRGSLALSSAGSFWIGEFFSHEGAAERRLFLACDKEQIEKFLANLKALVELIEISPRESSAEFYGLGDDKAFSIKVYQKGSVVSWLKFGSVDSVGRIFLRSQSNKKIWAADSKTLSPYLTARADFWAAPEIFPKDIVGSDKKYRHGRLALDSFGSPLLATSVNWSGALEKKYDPGDGNIYRALFLPKTDGDYYCLFSAQPSAQRPQEEKAALNKINSVFLASAWTFERVFESE